MFYSHLSMKGAPVAAIQALAGHADLPTTPRDIHLSPAALPNAARVPRQKNPGPGGGEKGPAPLTLSEPTETGVALVAGLFL